MNANKMVFAAVAVATMLVARGGTLGAVARVGDRYFESLQAAFDDADAAKGVTLVGDVVWADATEATLLTVAKGQSVALDLNGFSIMATNSLEVASRLFSVQGALTIDDTSADASGRIAFVPLKPSVYYESTPTYASDVFSMNGGSVTISKGTVVNEGKGSACYVFDNGGPGSTASTVEIKGGSVSAYGTVARLWADDRNAPERFTISGGGVDSQTRFGVQFFGIPEVTTAGTAEIRMTGGTISAATCAVYLYESRGGVTVDLSGGEVLVPSTGNKVYAIYAQVLTQPERGLPHDWIGLGGTTSVTGANGIYLYDSAGDVDFAMTGGSVTAGGYGLVYDNRRANTNGYDRAAMTISGGCLKAPYPLYIFDAGGGLTAEVSGGEIESTVSNYSVITMANDSIGTAAHPLDGCHTELTITGGTIKSTDGFVLGISDYYAAYDVLITGGTFVGWSYVYGYDASDPLYQRQDGPWVTVTGGTFTDFGVYYDEYYHVLLADPDLAGITLYGGTYDKRVSPTEFCRMAKTYVYVPSATAGSSDIVPGVAVSAQTVVNATWKLYSFGEEIDQSYLYAARNADVTAVWTPDDGYVFADEALQSSNTVKAATNPTVVPALDLTSPLRVAQVGETIYPSLAAAYAAAPDGQRITLLRDISADEAFVIDHPTLIDLNGFRYDGSPTGSFTVVGTTLKITANPDLGGYVTGAFATNGTSRVILFAGSYDTNVTNDGFVASGYTTEGENPWTVVAKSSTSGSIELKKSGEEVASATISTEALTQNAVSPEEVNDIGANGLTVWESIVLGLDSADATSLPWVKPEQQPDKDVLVVSVQEVEENDSVEGAEVLYVLQGSNSRKGGWVDIETRSDSQFTVHREIGGAFYKYYTVRTEIVFE